ncbi:MAG: YafY family transcriptional regulator [Bacteroidetes bacterium]|nr:YafY family transcriptional regulator [Bacteroidota bacterium]
MNRSDRMLAILLELQKKGTLRAEDLAEIFEVSRRSIYRDVEALCEAGVPVVAVPGRGYSLMDGYFLPPLSFTVEEATMLLVGGDVVAQNFDDEYRTAAHAAMEKLKAVLPGPLRTQVEELIRSIRFIQLGSLNRTEILAKLRLLRQAIIGSRRVRFRYNARGEGMSAPRRTVREADPYALSNLDGAWYLMAFCHLRNGVRNFRLSRMEELELTAETFARPAHAGRREDHDDCSVEAIVLFANEISPWVRESHFYYKAQQVETEQGMAVTLRAPNQAELIPWILQWGAKARVVSPLSLAESVRREAEKIVACYTVENTADTMVATGPQ